MARKEAKVRKHIRPQLEEEVDGEAARKEQIDNNFVVQLMQMQVLLVSQKLIFNFLLQYDQNNLQGQTTSSC
jgi:hypothetical protein